MFAIRDERDYVVQEDFMKAVRKLNDAKKLESSLTYDSSFGVRGDVSLFLDVVTTQYRNYRMVARSLSTFLLAVFRLSVNKTPLQPWSRTLFC